MYHVGPIWGEKSMLKMLVDHPLLRHDVAGEFSPGEGLKVEGLADIDAAQIDHRRFEMCEAYHMAMMAPLNEASRRATIDSGCFYAAKAVGCYVKQLKSQGLMPHDLAFSQRSMTSLVSSTKAIKTAEMSNPCKAYRCPCHDESNLSNLAQKLKDTADALLEMKRQFICLDCITTEGKSKSEGTCQGHDMDVSLVRHPLLAGILGSWSHGSDFVAP
jgi:hypothetical protein